MRYIIFGAGAVGGLIGAQLHAAGSEVVLIARGRSLDTLRTDGLTLQTSGGEVVHRVPVVGGPIDARISADDVVVLATKSQDTAAALTSLAAVAPDETPIVCAQNGVENERLASRYFTNVYAMYVYCFAVSLVPGVVQRYTAPSAGLCDIGRFPSGTDALLTRVIDDFVRAGFDSRQLTDAMAWKHGKLLANVGNALQAVAQDFEGTADVLRLARAEAEACFRSAQIPYVSLADQDERLASVLPLVSVDGQGFPGGSSWQSLVKGSSDVETAHLNGEIMMLGKVTGVSTPVNRLLHRLVRDHSHLGLPAGGMSTSEIRELAAQAAGGVAV